MAGEDVRINFKLTTGASSTDTKDLAEPGALDDNGNETRKFIPFGNLTIINTGTTSVKVRINNRKGYDVVPAGTIGRVEDDAINWLSVENMSSSAAAEIYLTLDSTPTVKSLLKQILGGRQ